MRREQRLRKRREFEEVQRGGLSRAHPLLILRAASNDLALTRFGFAVGRRAAPTAVVRNRLRRRLREVVRLLPVNDGWDVVFIARRGADAANFQQIREAVRDLLRRAGLLQRGESSPEEKR